MWILYGLGLAVVSRARLARAERTGCGVRVKVLVVSHLYPSPGVERHLFVHDQILALRDLGVETQVLSPTPYAPRILWRDPRQRRRGEKPLRAVRDGIHAEYPRVPQPPRRILFDRLGDIAYRSVHDLPSLKGGGFDLIHAHQALPDGALAQRLAADAGVPYVVTVHGADVYQHLRRGGSVADRAAAVLSSAAAVMANSSAVARCSAGSSRRSASPSSSTAPRASPGISSRRPTTCPASRSSSPAAT